MATDVPGGEVERLLAIMTRLRHPTEGCPWDRAQDFASIAPHTIEEAYEVADAIRRGDCDDLRDELGDLLFQVVYHSRMAEEAGHFDFHDVARGVADKLVRRHPHVFGNAEVASAEAQTQAWEAHKAAERRDRAPDPAAVSHLDGVSVALPAMTRAVKLQRRAARIGFDWSGLTGVLDKLAEEQGELEEALRRHEGPDRVAEEMGDLLFACANLARHLNVDPESALRLANSRFEARFRGMEAQMRAAGRSLEEASLAEMDVAWEKVKAEER
jgi:ATP diphosphatase